LALSGNRPRHAELGSVSTPQPHRAEQAEPWTLKQVQGDGRGADDVNTHWQTLGCPETIVKLGPNGARLPDGRIIPPPEILQPVDTSGAGDAFNGGYLAARINGAGVEDAAMTGHRLAGWCVMWAGAIPARD
jgi:sugar/nucleoside kinase (ribokinase family)